MDRAFSSGASGTPPSAPGSPSTGYATSGNPGTGTPATKPGAYWYHMVTEELRALIVAAGLTPDHTNTSQISQAVQAMIAAGAAPGVPVGAIVHLAMNAAPTGFLKANGAAVSRTTYAALFGVISTLYGAGNGSTTFNLPDLRGEFIRSFDDGRGVDSGRAIGTTQSGDNASHTHSVTDPGHAHTYSGPSGSTFGQPSGGAQSFTTVSTGSATTGISLATSGTEARPRNIALLACIKY